MKGDAIMQQYAINGAYEISDSLECERVRLSREDMHSLLDEWLDAYSELNTNQAQFMLWVGERIS